MYEDLLENINSFYSFCNRIQFKPDVVNNKEEIVNYNYYM